MVDVSALTDDELRKQLQDYGVNVGPVVSSTRLFYEKKLIKLIDSGGIPPTQQETESEEEEEEEYEEEVEEEEVQINYKQPQLYSSPPPAQPRPQVPAGYTPITQQRRASPTRATTVTHRPVSSGPTSQRTTSGPTPDKKTVKKSSGLALWIKLLFIIVVAILVYLVVINMNPSAQNKIPMSLDEEV